MTSIYSTPVRPYASIKVRPVRSAGDDVGPTDQDDHWNLSPGTPVKRL